MRTPLCDRFGIEHPIFAFTPSEHVAAAVSRAGGLGVLGCVRFNDTDELERTLSWLDDNTDGKPYGVDIVMPMKVPTEGSSLDLGAMIPEEHRRFVDETLLKLGVPPLPEGEGLGLGKPLKLLNKPERPSVPLWVAALGDKNVAMTAEVADGWLPFLYFPEKAHQVWGEPLARGAAKRSADLAPLEICAGGMVAIGEDVKGMLDFMRPMYALYVGGMGAREKNFYNDYAKRMGFEEAAVKIQDLYLDGKRGEAVAAVPDELVDAVHLVGSKDSIRERLQAWKEAGAKRHVDTMLVGTNQPEALELLAEEIL